jgi:CelD/BcsL family acetyltransferase involved in cellulose biosynthesis
MATPAGGKTLIRTLSSLPEIEEVSDQWQALEGRCEGRLTYFQSYSWCRNWVAAFADENSDITARIETVWNGDKLIAVWPMMTVSAAGLRVLQNLGEPHSQYCNFICDHERFGEDDARGLLARIEAGPACDVAVFHAVPEISPLSRLLNSRARVKGYVNSSSLLDLSGFVSSQAYAAQLGKLQKRNRNRRRNRMERIGPLDFTVIWPCDPRFADLVRRCAAMKRRWLIETARYSSGFSVTGYDAFLAGLAGDADALDGACLSVLRAGDRVVALELGFLKDRHYYSYLGGFDWDLRDLSPGKVQMDFTVGWLIDNGVAAYDLLGNPAEYKRTWSNRVIPLQAYTMPFSWKGHVYAQAWLPLLRPAAKHIFNALPDALRRLVARGQSFGLFLLYV